MREGGKVPIRTKKKKKNQSDVIKELFWVLQRTYSLLLFLLLYICAIKNLETDPKNLKCKNFNSPKSQSIGYKPKMFDNKSFFDEDKHFKGVRGWNQKLISKHWRSDKLYILELNFNVKYPSKFFYRKCIAFGPCRGLRIHQQCREIHSLRGTATCLTACDLLKWLLHCDDHVMNTWSKSIFKWNECCTHSDSGKRVQ